MENKLTAVEWLLDNLNFEPYDEEEFISNNKIWEQAKQMEKEQIKDAWLCGQTNGATICTPDAYEPKEKYYNETYKVKDN